MKRETTYEAYSFKKAGSKWKDRNKMAAQQAKLKERLMWEDAYRERKESSEKRRGLMHGVESQTIQEWMMK